MVTILIVATLSAVNFFDEFGASFETGCKMSLLLLDCCITNW